ncbi:MAG: 30S ribosomal protein S9 [Deltaproteobacteria bacterium]|nr:30S ribosomal protein S9 [Deltaproteobacteria bacterium]
MANETDTNRWYATGKRKTAIARVWLTPGKGEATVNGLAAADYFGRPTSLMIISQPFAITETTGKFDVRASVLGGGKAAQADAVKYGIAKALTRFNKDLRPPLKKAGFLTRDSRIKERKKYGQPGARKRFQYSKR